MAERSWRTAATIRHGLRLYLAENPSRMVLVTVVPRLLLQCVFYALLGRLGGGATGEVYALVGAVAVVPAGQIVVMAGDIPITDHWFSTFDRLRVGGLPVSLVYLCRAIPYAVNGAVMAALLALVCPLILGQPHLCLSLVRLLPLYLLAVAAATTFAVAVAGLSIGRRSDILLGNLAGYLLLALSGAVAPLTGHLGRLATLSAFIPVTHALQAVREALAGQPWTAQVWLEAGAGAGWLSMAVAVIALRTRATARPMRYRRTSR